MVKYLGLDYLKQAINQKQQFLNQALIAVPEHLEVVDPYIHHGNIEDKRYRFPWKRASCDDRFLNEEKKKAASFELVVPVIKYEENVEKFDCDLEDEDLGYFDLDEFIPSSNPESPISKDCEQSKTSSLIEVHHKVNLQDDWEKKIEEPLTQDLFFSLKKNLPTLKSLTGRLHQNQIKDPFSTRSSNNFDSLRLSSSEMGGRSERKDGFSEDFARVLVQDKMLLEETLSPFVLPTEENVLEQSCVMKDLKEITSQELVTEEMTLSSCTTNLYEHGETLSKELIEIKKKDSFLDINDIGDDDDMFESKALLDSPVVSAGFTLELENLQIKLLLQPLPRFQVSDSNLLKFLSSAEKESIENKIWQKEKYFNDILSLRITEPDVGTSLDSYLSLHSTMKQLELMKDEQVGDIELSLGWDPVGNIITTTKNVQKCLEKMDFSDKNKVIPELWNIKVEKYDSIELHDWQDDLIEITDTKMDRVLPVKASKEIISTEEDFGFDQIDDFFTLRTGMKAQRKPVKNLSFHTNHSNADVSEKLNGEQHIDKTNGNNSMPKIHSKIVTVQLGDKFQDILDTINEKVSYLRSSLRETGDVFPNQEMSSLNTDFTRFLLKQKEKQMTDSTDNEEMKESYKRVVCLHSLCGARDILLNCCLESAISHLQAADEKYPSCLTGSIEDVRQKLFQLSSHFQQRKIYHPKITATSMEIDKCLNSKDNSQKKILIMIKRNIPSFLNVLEEVVTHCSAITIKIQEESQIERIIKNLEECNCMIISKSLISSDFPWSMFNLVIEYEYEEQSVFCRECEVQNVTFVALKMDLKDVENNHQQEVSLNTETKQYVNVQQRTIIGSTQLTACGDILSLLETRYNLIVIERNYDIFGKSLFFADIDMTDRAGIILHSMKDMSDENQMELLLRKIISLSLKYTKCWILLCNFGRPDKSYPYAGNYVNNLCKLQASLGNFVSKHDSFDAKVLSCYTAEETCSSIRKICDIEMGSSDVWNNEEWRGGKWLKENATREEKFLLTLPCINSESSQIILKKMTLKELISSSQEHLMETLPMVSKRILQMLYSILHSSQGLNSRLHSVPEVNPKLCQQNYSRFNEHSRNDNQNMFMEQTSKDEQNQSLKNSISDSSHSKYFSFQERTLKQPIIGKNNEDNFNIKNINHLNNDKWDDTEDVMIMHKDAVHENDSRFVDSYSPLKHTKRTDFVAGTFPEKRCKLNFGRSQENFHEETKDDKYPYEETDTQDTNDVLSLHGSQSSIQLNEFEKAEIEGNVNRISCMEMAKAEFENVSSSNKINNRLTSSNCRYERLDPKSDFGILNPTIYQNNDKSELDTEDMRYMMNGHGMSSYRPSSQYDLLNYQQVHSKEYFNNKPNSFNHFQSPEIIVYNSQDLGNKTINSYSKKSSNPHINATKSDKLQYSVSENIQDIDNAKKNSESRNFTRDLSETTRNILRQAYQSPRFGVRPSRSFTHRISVGLAQPVRREKTSKESSNDRMINSRSNAVQNEATENEIITSNHRPTENGKHKNTQDERSHRAYNRQDCKLSHIYIDKQQQHEGIYRPVQHERNEIYKDNKPSGETSNHCYDNRNRQPEHFNKRQGQSYISGKKSGRCYGNDDIENDKDGGSAMFNKGHTDIDGNRQTFIEESYNYGIQHTRNNTQLDKLSSRRGNGFEHLDQTPKRVRHVNGRNVDEHNRSCRQWQDYDSPPMDLDYLDNLVGSQLFNEQNGYSSRDCYMNQTQDMTNRMLLTNDRSVPNKKRKLSYTRQPGSRGGQTKLVFK